MSISETPHVLVVGKRNRKVNEVEDTLGRYFPKVTVVSELADIDSLFANDYLDLIVVTDSIREKLDKGFLIELRHLFPRVKVLGLFDHINQDTEVALRSGGLIFLGSYKHFQRLSPAILHAALGSTERKR